MGISGLLPLLKSIHKNTTLKKFAGQTIGIDGYGWLHRGAAACALELALGRPTTRFVDFAMSRVRMLLDFGIIPYVIFDGDSLPSKAGTNEERRNKRDEAKAKGLSLYKAGKTSQAWQELQKAIGVTPYMARQLIEELKKLDIQYIVAPYEADAQLAYLERRGIIDGILSEDSDLLVFGARRLITKLNQYGECIEIERADFPLCKDISLAGWTDTMFRRMAVLSGCDYLSSMDNMGLKTAYRYVRKYKDVEKTLRMVAFEGKFVVPADYLEKFKHAENTFVHHRVFCPVQQKMVFLAELERGMSEDEMPYLGVYVEPETAIGVACGDLDPKTKRPIEVKVSAMSRPTLRDNRRQTVATPTDLKKKSSLDNFFKPQRTPLQELDPNSLTPSPSQQRLLQMHRNTSWEPRAVSSAPQLRRTSTAIAPTSSGTERRAFLARASTMSNYQPVKRQRLCSEAEDLSPSRETKQSPFFTSNSVTMSPLDHKKSRSRRTKQEFDVWSDDSVDGVLLGLVGEHEHTGPTQITNHKTESGKVGADNSQSQDIDTIPQSSPLQASDESQGPQYSTAGTQSQPLQLESSLRSQNTVISTVENDDGIEAFEDLLEYHVRQQNKKVAKTFASQSPRRREAALESLSPSRKRNAVSPGTEVSESEALQSTHVQWASPSQKNSNAESLVATSPPPASSMFKTFLYQSSEVQKAALQSLPRKQPDAEKIELARAALADERKAMIPGRKHTANKPVGKLHRLSTKASNASLHGSEDALVPNSEDEISSAEDEAVRPKSSIKSFVFKG